PCELGQEVRQVDNRDREADRAAQVRGAAEALDRRADDSLAVPLPSAEQGLRGAAKVRRSIHTPCDDAPDASKTETGFLNRLLVALRGYKPLHLSVYIRVHLWLQLFCTPQVGSAAWVVLIAAGRPQKNLPALYPPSPVVEGHYGEQRTDHPQHRKLLRRRNPAAPDRLLQIRSRSRSRRHAQPQPTSRRSCQRAQTGLADGCQPVQRRAEHADRGPAP